MANGDLSTRILSFFRGAAPEPEPVDIHARPYDLSPQQTEMNSRLTRARQNENLRPTLLSGPGASEVRAAQGYIRAAARRAPSSGGIRAKGHLRSVLLDRDGKTSKTTTFATIPTPAHLTTPDRASSLISQDARALLELADSAREQRENASALMEKLASGKPDVATRVRIHHLLASALSLTERNISPVTGKGAAAATTVPSITTEDDVGGLEDRPEGDL